MLRESAHLIGCGYCPECRTQQRLAAALGGEVAPDVGPHRIALDAHATPVHQAEVVLRILVGVVGRHLERLQRVAIVPRLVRLQTTQPVFLVRAPLGCGHQLVDGPPSGSFFGPGSRNQLDVPPTADELYGQEGGLRRLSTYWQQQDRLLEGNVEVGPLQNVPTPKGGNGMDG